MAASLDSVHSYHINDVSSLKNEQIRAIDAAKVGDVLVVLPTGYGKTIIIQELPFIETEKIGCVIVVNPLNAIIVDQAVRFGEDCVVIDNKLLEYLNNRQGGSISLKRASEKLDTGHVAYILGHPENLLTDIMKKTFQKEPLASKVIIVIIKIKISISINNEQMSGAGEGEGKILPLPQSPNTKCSKVSLNEVLLTKSSQLLIHVYALLISNIFNIFNS